MRRHWWFKHWRLDDFSPNSPSVRTLQSFPPYGSYIHMSKYYYVATTYHENLSNRISKCGFSLVCSTCALKTSRLFVANYFKGTKFYQMSKAIISYIAADQSCIVFLLLIQLHGIMQGKFETIVHLHYRLLLLHGMERNGPPGSVKYLFYGTL